MNGYLLCNEPTCTHMVHKDDTNPENPRCPRHDHREYDRMMYDLFKRTPNQFWR